MIKRECFDWGCNIEDYGDTVLMIITKINIILFDKVGISRNKY